MHVKVSTGVVPGPGTASYRFLLRTIINRSIPSGTVDRSVLFLGFLLAHARGSLNLAVWSVMAITSGYSAHALFFEQIESLD